MSLKSLAAAAALFAFAGAATSASAGTDEVNAGLGYMRDYNLIVLGDLTTNSEVEGRTFVSGSVFGNASNYNKNQLAGVGLTVVGDVEGGKKNVWGDIAIGGNVDSGVEFQSSGAQELQYGGALSSTNVNSPDTANHVAGLGATLGAQAATMATDLGELSTYLSTLTTTEAYTVNANNIGFDANASSDAVAVFSLSDLSVFTNKYPDFTYPTGYDLVVVNVSGTNLSFPGGFNFNGPSGLGTKVIWNFYEATTLNFNTSFYGSVLAPNAVVSTNNFVEGTLVAKTLNAGGEVHMSNLGGTYTVPGVPEPATWALMILGFGGAGAMLRRRRALFA
ncbi:MAG: choice-of-anchor A family protein [Phenylobacterium sp.]|uniref:choice-of-anchor A family protein n=1 Tax=Phenylobacterium sp. TaxID=1871053 RepID=UPI0025E0A3B1|nr:choice-of-anchor A family protein [Phenylobacterium sp.]MBI1197704.1 choice-of-anchor A family protein [Phenylobacterium sp.]